MRKILVTTVIVIAVGLGTAATALADSSINLDQLDKSRCGAGELIVDVEHGVLNDHDSGVAGNSWALDAYEREIRVWQTGVNTFCAIVRYDGEFVTLAGASPGGSSTVAAGVEGDLEGGYRTTEFTATFAPTRPTDGDLGTFDYGCDVSPSCPGRVSWFGFYFTNISGLDLAWWGWSYDAGDNGFWVNSIDGNSGDITGSAGEDDEHEEESD